MAYYTNQFILLFLITLSYFLVISNASSINVVSFGAKSGGNFDSTASFLRAWSFACQSKRPFTIYVPKGTFLLKQVIFEGPCISHVKFRIDGTIVAPSNYWSLGNSGYWIMFWKLNGISIRGGIFDGRGGDYWRCKKPGNNCPAGSRSLNTDGITVQSSSRVNISHATIKTGDDCISIKQGSSNVWIEHITCGPGHGISVGSLGAAANEAGVEKVTVTNSIFIGTQNGVRIKSWAKPSNGYARDIVFRNLTMQNVNNPIIIDQRYCPSRSCSDDQNSGVMINRVSYEQIKGTSASPVAIYFDCSRSKPCGGIKLQDIKLDYYKGFATSYCTNVGGIHSGVVIPKSCL